MHYAKITSFANPVIREAMGVKERRRRYRKGMFVIEGPHSVEMALASEFSLRRVFVSEAFGGRSEGKRLLRALEKRVQHDGIIIVSEDVMARLADTETPQGILAVVSYADGDLQTLHFKGIPLFIVCDGIQDPGNLGSIIRVADAADADGIIILPGTSDVFMPKVIRATAGSIFSLSVVQTDPSALIEYLNTKEICLYVADVRGSASLYETDLRRPAAIAFGNEAYGVSESLFNNAKYVIRIPIFGKAESLNVAMAASICLYEAVRQRIGLGIKRTVL